MKLSSILLLAILSLIFNVSSQRNISCTLPKDPGSGKDSLQKFYYDRTWAFCMRFIYSGKEGNTNRFDIFSECHTTCGSHHRLMCMGPSSLETPLNFPVTSCDYATCKEGYICDDVASFSMCCNKSEHQAKTSAFDKKCPDGSKAGGINETGYFQTTFGSTCEDLICSESEKCLQINKYFAKCCEIKYTNSL